MIRKFEAIKAVCPIYVGTERQRPELIGSGTLLDFGKGRFIVTAAHVHDQSTKLYTLGSNLLRLPKTFVKTSLPASGERKDDRLDFAFARLDEPMADELAKRHCFLPFMLIDCNDQLTPDACYMFSGYPRSRAEKDYGKKRIMPKLWTRTDSAATPEQMTELGYPPETHVAVRYNPAHDTNEYGKPRHFPSAKGMSGGAVWRGSGNPKDWLQTAQVRLVGIGIEDRPNDQLMIGVRIHCITALIGERYTDIRPFAGRRFGFGYTYQTGIVN
jgi:hypothetical protein